MDIEGAEHDALQGAEKTLKKYSPTILFATHSERVKAECNRFLKSLGYNIKSISSDEFVAIRNL